MSEPSFFGEVSGHPVGTTFDSRHAVKAAGLHRHLQAGISGNYDQGADAIIVSGGYVDDQDEGDRIVYTGQGGRSAGSTKQVTDQELSRGNLALVRSEQAGLPVRVIRGSSGDPRHSPTAGYRYDGLFYVTQHWIEPSVDGPLILRYSLERTNEGAHWGAEAAAGEPPEGDLHPGRATGVVQRVVRNSDVTQWVKNHYEGECQVCGDTLDTPSGPYAEGAHIRALGKPHNGPDIVSNVLCLCPNDHVLLDKGAIYLEDGEVRRSVDDALLGKLRVRPGHQIDWLHAEYHRVHFAAVG